MNEQLQFAQMRNPDEELDQFINGLLLGNVALSPELRELLSILKWQKGAANAKSLADIAAKLNTNPRAVKALVKQLIQEYGVPIGGSRQEPIGYFLLITREDWTLALGPLVGEIRSLRERVDALKGSPFFSMVCGQMDLDLGDERKAG